MAGLLTFKAAYLSSGGGCGNECGVDVDVNRVLTLGQFQGNDLWKWTGPHS